MLSSYLESKISLTNYQKISADINRDRILNQEDVTLILQYYALGKNGDYVGLSDLAGDVNGDGDTNISDATCIQRALAEYFDFTELDAIIADVNGDGIANISDVTALQRYLAEIEKNICVSQVNVLPYSVRTDRVLKLGVGESSELNVRILPLSLNDFNLIWTSSDETVATVSSDGIIKAVGMGTAQITIKVQNGPKTSCNVLVNENSDYTFVQNDDGTISITGYTGSDTSLTIPSTIYGKTVKSIDANSFKNNTQITNIEVSNGISYIGESAFANCGKLESVTLPDSVTEIGKMLFLDCAKLTQVRLSDNLTVLPYYTFRSCKLLTDVNMPMQLQEIGTAAFSHCEALENLTLPNGLTTIRSAFGYCTSLKSIIIPDSVTSIESFAFEGCSSLSNVTLSANLTKISNNMFMKSGIVSITIPNKVEKIQSAAFEYCTKLTSVVIPDSVKVIDNWCFAYCDKLKSIDLASVQSIGYSAFRYSGMEEFNVPSSLTSLGNCAFAGCSNLASVVVPENNTSYCSEDGILFSKDKHTIILYPAARKGTSFAIPDGVETIGYAAFSGAQFETVTLPDSVISLVYNAFENCSNLISFEFPQNVHSIPSELFTGCEKLRYVLGTEEIYKVDYKAFDSCYSLRMINLPNAITIDNNAFHDCRSLSSIVLNDHAYICYSAFSGCYSLGHLFKCSGNGNYAGYTSENPVDEWYVESDNNALLNAVTCVGNQNDYLFEFNDVSCGVNGSLSFQCGLCNHSDNLSIESALTHEYQMVSVISPTCTEGGYTVYRCSRCGNAYHGDETEATGHNYISTSTVAPTCTTKGYTVYRCQTCGNEYNGNYVSATGHHYVDGECEYCGEVDPSAVIITGTTGDCNWSFNESTGTLIISGNGKMGNYSSSNSAPWRNYTVKSVVIENGVTNIGLYSFGYCKNLINVTIPDSVTSIGASAFNNCSGLKSITLPDTVISLGSYAFNSCTSLTSVNIPNSVTSIESNTFYCTKITSISIPVGVTRIGNNAFRSCSNLSSISIPSSVSNIGEYAFYGCSKIASIAIPDSVTSIGSAAFSDCSSLTEIIIPNSVASIGSHAFYNCSALSSVSIPDIVTTIDMYTFYGCSSLESIYISKNLTSIEKKAFANCYNLKSIVFCTSALTISDEVFVNCNNLEHVFLHTDTDCWNQYVIGAQNDSLTSVAKHWGEVNNESSYTECGKEFQVTESCSVCGYVIGHKTEKLEHCYIPSETVAPTCTEQGYTTYKCLNCGDSYQSDLKKPLGHQYNISIVSPTYEEQGYDLHKCVRCEYSYRDNYTDMLIKAERIDIENEVYLYSGNSYQLNAKIYPQNTSDNTMLWSSNKTSVATVDNNGYVTAVSAGIATITVTNFDQSVISVCEIKVSQVVSYIESGTYCLKLKGTNSYLDHQGGNANGMNVHLWSGDGSSNPNQKIKIDRIDDNRHKLWSATSTDLLIDVNRGNSYDDPLKIGLNVDLWKNNDWQAQEWLFTKTYDGYYIIRLNMLQDGALEASGVDNGANIYFGSFDLNNDMQKWELVNTSDYAVKETTAWVYNTAEIGNVHVRSGPGTNYSSIGGFNEAQQITVIGNTSDEWLKVRGVNRHDGDTIQGYTHRDYIRFH